MTSPPFSLWLGTLALCASGCALSVTGATGVTIDTAGHVGVFAKAGSSEGAELSAHKAGQQTHGSIGFLHMELTGGYDITGRRGFGFLDARLGGTGIWDRPEVGVSPSAGIRLGGFTGGSHSFVVGPVLGSGLYHVRSRQEKDGCQPGEAAHSHHLLGGMLDAAWLFPRGSPRSFGMFFLGPAYQYHGTFALCFSERGDRAQ